MATKSARKQDPGHLPADVPPSLPVVEVLIPTEAKPPVPFETLPVKLTLLREGADVRPEKHYIRFFAWFYPESQAYSNKPVSLSPGSTLEIRTGVALHIQGDNLDEAYMAHAATPSLLLKQGAAVVGMRRDPASGEVIVLVHNYTGNMLLMDNGRILVDISFVPAAPLDVTKTASIPPTR